MNIETYLRGVDAAIRARSALVRTESEEPLEDVSPEVLATNFRRLEESLQALDPPKELQAAHDTIAQHCEAAARLMSLASIVDGRLRMSAEHSEQLMVSARAAAVALAEMHAAADALDLDTRLGRP